jgi:hypothetical protein
MYSLIFAQQQDTKNQQPTTPLSTFQYHDRHPTSHDPPPSKKNKIIFSALAKIERAQQSDE